MTVESISKNIHEGGVDENIIVLAKYSRCLCYFFSPDLESLHLQ